MFRLIFLCVNAMGALPMPILLRWLYFWDAFYLLGLIQMIDICYRLDDSVAFDHSAELHITNLKKHTVNKQSRRWKPRANVQLNVSELSRGFQSYNMDC